MNHSKTQDIYTTCDCSVEGFLLLVDKLEQRFQALELTQVVGFLGIDWFLPHAVVAEEPLLVHFLGTDFLPLVVADEPQLVHGDHNNVIAWCLASQQHALL